jgi:hypothetical protein
VYGNACIDATVAGYLVGRHPDEGEPGPGATGATIARGKGGSDVQPDIARMNRAAGRSV